MGYYVYSEIGHQRGPSPADVDCPVYTLGTRFKLTCSIAEDVPFIHWDGCRLVTRTVNWLSGRRRQ
jgi:hypothetical protein